MKRLTFLTTSLLALLAKIPARGGEKNEKCPVMTAEDIDAEQTVEYDGIPVRFCCRSCIKVWNRNPRYVIKASAALLPQFEGMADKLELDKVVLLEQRFCPVNTTNLVTPDSPSVDFKGVKVYLWDEDCVKKWNEDPEGCARRAGEAGLLPQLPKKASPSKDLSVA